MFCPGSILVIPSSPSFWSLTCQLKGKEKKGQSHSANLKRKPFLSHRSSLLLLSLLSGLFSAIHIQLLWGRKLLWGGSHASSDPPATFPSPRWPRLWPSAAATLQWPRRILQQRAVMWHSHLRGSEWSSCVRQRANGQWGTTRICTNYSCVASR